MINGIKKLVKSSLLFSSPNPALKFNLTLTHTQNRFSLLLLSLLLLTFIFFFSGCSIEPPEIADINIGSIIPVDKQSFNVDFIIDIKNPNSIPLQISLTNLNIYKLEKETLSQIEDPNQHNFSNLILSPDLVISHLDQPLTTTLTAKANTIVRLELILKKDLLLSSVLSLLLNQEIDLLFRGNLTFHHWTGNYPLTFNHYYLFDLKHLFK